MRHFFYSLLLVASSSASSSGRYLVRLCSEDSREHVSRHVTRWHAARDVPEFNAEIDRHIVHLERLPSFVLKNVSQSAYEELNDGLGGKVCGLEKMRKVYKFEDLSPIGDTWWHVDRLNGEIDGDGANEETYTGAGVNIFVLDTGLDATHPEFGGRAANVASFTDDTATWQFNEAWGLDDPPSRQDELGRNDYDGHGTHCAGDCCGGTTGPASGASVWGVKVLGNDGSGLDDWILGGLDLVAGLKSGALASEPVIVSLSLGGLCESGDPEECSQQGSYSDAINSLWDLGVPVVVAAGNDGDDACFYVPAAITNAITVGSTDIEDQVSSFSNYGACVDIMAPGSSIPSTASSLLVSSTPGLIENNEYYVLSGTSMATPQVAGVLAQYVEAMGLPSDVTQASYAMFNGAVSGDLSYSNNDGAGASSCASNNLFVRTPEQSVDDSLYELVCELPDERDVFDDDNFYFGDDVPEDDEIVDLVDYYDPTVEGYCLSDLDRLIFDATSPERCWRSCESQFGSIVSIDFYEPIYCYCQNSCDCMIPVINEGTTLVLAGTQLPDQCPDDDPAEDDEPEVDDDLPFTTYPLDSVGWCFSSLNQGYQFDSTVNAEICWNLCVQEHGANVVVAADFYPGVNICYCQNGCSECIDTTAQGYLLVLDGFEIPCDTGDVQPQPSPKPTSPQPTAAPSPTAAPLTPSDDLTPPTDDTDEDDEPPPIEDDDTLPVPDDDETDDVSSPPEDDEIVGPSPSPTTAPPTPSDDLTPPTDDTDEDDEPPPIEDDDTLPVPDDDETDDVSPPPDDDENEENETDDIDEIDSNDNDGAAALSRYRTVAIAMISVTAAIIGSMV